MNVTRYNGKRIALVMDVQGREVVLRGITSFRNDPRQGQMLQVTVIGDDAAGAPVFLISQSRWTPHISSGLAYDCEYMLDLSEASVTAN